jgi:uncharacterized protein HemY
MEYVFFVWFVLIIGIVIGDWNSLKGGEEK